MATHSSILAWEIPWTEEPGRLQFMGSQRVGHDLSTKQHSFLVVGLTAGAKGSVFKRVVESSSQDKIKDKNPSQLVQYSDHFARSIVVLL